MGLRDELIPVPQPSTVTDSEEDTNTPWVNIPIGTILNEDSLPGSSPLEPEIIKDPEQTLQ